MDEFEVSMASIPEIQRLEDQYYLNYERVIDDINVFLVTFFIRFSEGELNEIKNDKIPEDLLEVFHYIIEDMMIFAYKDSDEMLEIIIIVDERRKVFKIDRYNGPLFIKTIANLVEN